MFVCLFMTDKRLNRSGPTFFVGPDMIPGDDLRMVRIEKKNPRKK